MESILERLTGDQKNTLEQLKKNLGTVLDDSHTDELLVKFLRAKNFNLKAAEKIFLENYFGRIVFGSNSILDTYEKSEIVKKYEATGSLGFAKDGTAIRYIAVGRLDFYGAVMTFSSFDLILYLLHEIEWDLNALREQSLKTGKPTTEVTYIFDYNHFRLQQILHKNVIEMGMDVIRLYQDCYPEIWRRFLIINAPNYFDVILKMFNAVMRSFLTEKFFVASPDDSKELLLKYIDEDVLPAFLGGKRVDVFGDPMCKEFMTFGGKIPEKLYASNCQALLSSNDPDVLAIHVGRQSVFNLTVKIEEPDSQMRLQARTGSGSLYIKVFYKELDSQINNDVDTPGEFEYLDDKWENFKHFSFEFKSELHNCQEDMKLYFPWPGMYVINFSNASSWFSSRKLFIKYNISSPTSQSSG